MRGAVLVVDVACGSMTQLAATLVPRYFVAVSGMTYYDKADKDPPRTRLSPQ